MRDLIDDPHPAYTEAMMTDLVGRGGRQSPAGGVYGDSALRAAPHPFAGPPRPRYAMCEVAWADALSDLELIYGDAMRVMDRAGSTPITGTERWFESDAAYLARIRNPSVANEETWATLTTTELDAVGRGLGLPRPRLIQSLETING